MICVMCLVVLVLVETSYGWRIPGPSFRYFKHFGDQPRSFFSLNAIRFRPRSNNQPTPSSMVHICINEEITADPVRLIAPKVNQHRLSRQNAPPHNEKESEKDSDQRDSVEADVDGEDDEYEDNDDIEQGDESDGDEQFVEEEGTAEDDGSAEEMLGIVSLEDALQKALEFDLDLVMINDKAVPPVCKIINFHQHKVQMEKKLKKQKKRQKLMTSKLKEVKMSYRIGTHDFDVRLRQAQKFVDAGDKVKVTVQFKGREMAYPDLAMKVLTRFYDGVSAVCPVCILETPPKMEGREMFMFIAGKKKKT